MGNITLAKITIALSFGLLILGPVFSNANAACISYSSTSATITITCTSATHLKDVDTALKNPAILKSEGSGVWLLSANLLVSKGGSFLIDSSDTTWLKIISDGKIPYGLKNSGNLKIDSVKITSWNPSTNTVASPGTDGSIPRGFIVALSGGTGKMDVLNSEIAHLGYSGTGNHGFDYYGSDGSLIQNNQIHDNWRAFYSSGVGGLVFTKNTVHDNYEYGIDPHTATHDMTITYNKSYNNNHGIICSQRCYNLDIEHNELYNNLRNGIYLDAGSHHSTVANNNIHEEEVGITLPSLSSSEVYGNTISNSKYGIKLDTQIGSDYDKTGGCGSIGCGSTNNNIHDNSISVSTIGIIVKGGAASNTISSNTINAGTGGSGIIVYDSATKDNAFKDNRISAAKYGIQLTSGNTGSKFINTHFDNPIPSGEYTLASTSALNIENTNFAADVIRDLDSSSTQVGILDSGSISVIDGITGKTTNYDTDASEYTSTLSSSGKITVTSNSADTTPPGQVTGLTVTAQSTNQLDLGWTANSESDLNHYNVYRGTTSGFSVNPGVTAPSGTSSTNSYQSTGLAASTTYYYKVAAVDNAGNIGPLSSEKSGTTSGNTGGGSIGDTTPPKQVTGLTVKAESSTQIKLSWSKNSEKDLDHYLIYKGMSSSFKVSPGTTAPTGSSTSSSYTDPGLNPSTKYYYKVAAVDNAGNVGPLSNSKSATTKSSDSGSGSSSSKLSKVSGLSIKAKSDVQLDLKWSKPKGSNIDHYNIYKSISSKFIVVSGVTEPSGKSSTTSYSSTGLSPSTKYYYKVAAVDNAGNVGPLSKSKSATTKSSDSGSGSSSSKLSKVSGLSIKAKSDVQLDLKWSKPKGSNIDHYNIYKSKSSKITIAPGATEPSGTSSSTSYSSTGLDPDTKYYYKVAVVDHAGNVGPPSDTKSGNTQKSSSKSLQSESDRSISSLPRPELTIKAETNNPNLIQP